ncbi:ABC transporter permease [Radiobacillus sp. PE A8.2]|uniref:ABC transporter permease n=1 Tax=Radiobacillus sp. PE A8.2 TaxID=3380349 RepID=UPI00388ED2CE
MFNAGELFRNRLSSHFIELSRYLRYMFTGHFVIALLFIISAMSYFYQAWLEELPDAFPSAFVIAVVFGLTGSYSPIRTLLKEPDLVFLLPAEHKMGTYFRYALVYSFCTQLYIVLLVGAALAPLYFAAFPLQTTREYFMLLCILLIFKLWSLLANWWVSKLRQNTTRLMDQIIRLLLAITAFYFFLQTEMLLATIITITLFGLTIFDWYLASQKAGVAWDVLVENDRNSMRAFYRIANLFTDVPHLKNEVKKRHWLVRLFVSAVPFKQEYTFNYLYRITTARSGDYLGIYMRLLIIGGLCIYYVPNFWIKIIFSILFIYLSAFQLMTMWQHHRTIIWLDIYPTKIEWRKKALKTWLLRLMIVQVFLFGLLFLFLGNVLGLVIVWIGGTLFSLSFIQGYVARKMT